MDYKRLEDCCISISDGDHQAPPKVIQGVPFITISNIDTAYNSINFENTMFVPFNYYDRLDKKRKAKKGDILYTVVGSFGIPVLIKDNSEFAFQRHIAILRPNTDIIIPEYMYYVMKSNDFYAQADAFAVGAAQRTISLTSLRRMWINVPSIHNQIEISSKIQVYDLLIENNVKRINLLEQMAENLYKEWFVRFKFSGYESCEFKESNPKGWIFGDKEITYIPKLWHFGELKELGQFVRGKNITAEKMIEGSIPVISAGISPSGYHNQATVLGKSITISSSGANAGYLLYHLSDIWAADCSYYQNDNNLWFVYNALKFLQPVISNMQAGAAQPHVYPKHVNKISMIIPEDKWIRKYCEIVNPIYDEIKLLKTKNDNLIKQRDLLLPRLMSGRLKVK